MKAIGHPIRLRILEVLEREAEAGVSHLVEQVGTSQPLVSQQLARMRLEGVLGSERRGTRVIYFVAMPAVLGVLDCIRKLKPQVQTTTQGRRS